MKRVTALQRVYYDRHEYAPGETFNIDDDLHAQMLDTLGTVKIEKDAPSPAPTKAAPGGSVAQHGPGAVEPVAAPKVPPEKIQPPQPPPFSPVPDGAISAGPMTTESAGALTGKPKRQYKRRDMRAED